MIRPRFTFASIAAVLFALTVMAAAVSAVRPSASIELRKAMSRRFYGENTIRWVATSLTCRKLASTSAQPFRYLCTFANHGEKGAARVELGKAPTWHVTVTVTRLTCLVEPNRRGCP